MGPRWFCALGDPRPNALTRQNRFPPQLAGCLFFPLKVGVAVLLGGHAVGASCIAMAQNLSVYWGVSLFSPLLLNIVLAKPWREQVFRSCLCVLLGFSNGDAYLLACV